MGNRNPHHGRQTVRWTELPQARYSEELCEKHHQNLTYCLSIFDSHPHPIAINLRGIIPGVTDELVNMKKFICGHAYRVEGYAGINGLAGPYLLRLRQVADYVKANYPPVKREKEIHLVSGQGLSAV